MEAEAQNKLHVTYAFFIIHKTVQIGQTSTPPKDAFFFTNRKDAHIKAGAPGNEANLAEFDDESPLSLEDGHE